MWSLCGMWSAGHRSYVCTQTARDFGKVCIWLPPGENALNLGRMFKKDKYSNSTNGMWFVRTYLKANLKISFKLKTFFLLQAPFLRIYSIEVKLPIRREYIHRDIIGAKILAILSGKIFVTKWVRAKPIGTGILWKAERCARTPQIVTCHISQKSDSYHLPGNERKRVLFFFPWMTRSCFFNSPVQTQITEYFAHICSQLHSWSDHW